MRGRQCRAILVGVMSGFLVILWPSVAHAGVGVSVPASAALGTAATGSTTLSGHLGTFTVTDSGLGLLASFSATVVLTTTLGTGGRTTAETIPKSSVFYWSGPVTASSGLQTAVPGQLAAAQAQDLSVQRTALSVSGVVLATSTSWNPTIIINIPTAAVAGSYSGTITTSVA